MKKFPSDFMWGAATSSHQVEGDNFFNDWWEWEQKGKTKEPSGFACRHYDLYPQDFRIAAELNHNTHRFSVEWSRIEPEEGKFNRQELRHYQDMVVALKAQHLEPIVTLNHFTLPLWFSRKRGWLNPKADFYFLRYLEKIVIALCPYVRYWVTFNEPLVYVYNAYMKGIWPPEEHSCLKAKLVINNLARAHLAAYRQIKKIYQEKFLSEPQISIAKHLREFISYGGNPYHRLLAGLKDYFFNFWLLDRLWRRGSLDFLGVNYYTVDFIPAAKGPSENLSQSNLNWPIYPQGLFNLLLRLRRYRLPVFILENGISTDNDALRWNFIQQHLKSLYQASQEGVKIIGYLYWSLLDNFEWEKGFLPHFGLVEIDYQTFRRSIRGSARRFARVCATGELDNGN